jgi:hypothetical protein
MLRNPSFKNTKKKKSSANRSNVQFTVHRLVTVCLNNTLQHNGSPSNAVSPQSFRTVAVLLSWTACKPVHWGYSTQRGACGQAQNEPPSGCASVCLLAHSRTHNVLTTHNHSVGWELYTLPRGCSLSSPNLTPYNIHFIARPVSARLTSGNIAPLPANCAK